MAKPSAHWRDHWNKHAGQWEKIGSPLRPCEDDVNAFRRGISGSGSNGLLLGATPELATIGNITAIDRNPEMAQLATCKIVQGEWLAMPFAADSFDFAIGDGSLNMLQYAGQYEQIFELLVKTVKPAGKISFRLFATPEKPESIGQVMEDAFSGKIISFHSFKWRLAMAMVAEMGSPNINVAAIHKTFTTYVPEREKLVRYTGWMPESINTIDVYNGSAVTYSFPKLSELRNVAAKYFNETGIEYGNYELAERCPVITYSIKS